LIISIKEIAVTLTQVILIFLFMPIVALAKGPRTIAYGDLPNLIREKNENLKAARASVEAQEKRTGHFGRSFLPRISANLGQEDFRTDSFASRSQSYWRLNASVNVYRGGRDLLDEKIRENTFEIAQVDYSREYQSEMQRAQSAFWSLVATEKLMADRKEEIQQNEENIKSSRKRAGAGVATAADAIQFELHHTTLVQNLKKLELERDAFMNRLSVVLGLDEHENITINQDFPSPSEMNSEFAAFSADTQLEIKSLRSKEDIEELRSKQSGRWWHPKVDLYAGYGLPSLSDGLTPAINKEKETVAGIVLSLDLGQGASDFREAQSKELEAKSAGFRAAQKTRELVAADHELRHDLRLLAELIKGSDKDIGRAKQFLTSTQGEYSRGVKNGPDLLSAFQKYYEFKERRIALYRNYYDAKAELEAILAKPEIL
jgi:outer membrane protein TolC